MATGYIYVIANVITGQCYVGQTSKAPEARWNAHRASWRRGDLKNPRMLRSVQFHGQHAFRFGVLEICSAPNIDQLRRDLTIQEDFWMEALRDRGVVLYNVYRAAETTAGRPSPKRGVAMSDAQKSKMSVIKRGNKHHLGHTHTAETKAAIAAKKRGRPSEKRGTTISAEQREKLRIAHTGLVQSPEHLAARSKAIKGRSWVMVDGKRRYSPRIDVDLTFQCTSP